jgi:hypothetical protein
MTRTVTNRGLRGRGRPHKYLVDPIEVDEAPDLYRIEDGVLVDDTERPEKNRAYDEFTRYWQRSKEDLRAEEAGWAARCGPVTIIQKGCNT